MAGRRKIIAFAGLLALAACGQGEAPDQNRQNANGVTETVDVPQTVDRLPPGTTPMAERVAVVRLLNKRNGQMREFSLRPGQAVRAGDVIVRLRACETTASWEVQQLTGAFVQLDVRNPQGQFQRVFSGWLYKESPSLNVVEHPIYDVWPMSCAMTHPEGGAPAGPDRPDSSRSSASNAAAPAEEAAPAANAPAPPAEPIPPAPSPSADDSN
jgi:hypothetical protein